VAAAGSAIDAASHLRRVKVDAIFMCDPPDMKK
jgi:hypothetical protein